MNLLDLIAEPIFADRDEHDYAMASIDARERFFARSYFVLGTFSPVILTIVWSLGLMGFTEFALVTTFQSLQMIVGIYFLMGSKSTTAIRFATLYSFIVMQLAWTVGAKLSLQSGHPSMAYNALWLLHIYVGCVLLAFRSRVHHFMFAFIFGTTCFGFYGFPNFILGTILLLVTQLGGQNFQILVHRFFKRMSMFQYREKARYVPRYVLLKTARDGTEVEKVFAPKQRFCVCICSDWRNFQSIATDENAQVLGERLAEYYNRIINRLNKDVEDGKFFMDWIADELFVVLFSDDEKEDFRLVEKGFDLSIWLLSHRRSFSREFGYPTGIDVGLSAGLASVGIFGPKSGVKATAFGMIPGYARRLQGLAKQLRVDYGDQDRVVISNSAAEIIEAENAQCSRLELNGAYEVRDGMDQSAYVWPKLSWQVGKLGNEKSEPTANSGKSPQEAERSKRPA